MNISCKRTSRLLSLSLASSLLLGLMTTGVSAAETPQSQTRQSSASKFQPKVTYEVTVTDAEREKIHQAVEDLAGDVGDMIAGDGSYDPNTLVGALATGSSYDSISYKKDAAGSIPTEYPFAVPNTDANYNEHDRKAAKLAWVKELGAALGLEVVQRQDDKYVYVEIGDPDAPEMVMALSHLDSPVDSNNWRKEGGNFDRWRNYDGELDREAYHTPYVRDGWLYGAGVQDDSGPTLATLFAAKALQDSGVEFDRRIRIVMGIYEDGSPGVPSAEDTLKYMDIPYYTGNPSFYDNWAYKSLNREETPIAAYTSDSRFPVVVGNSKEWVPNLTMDLSQDQGKPFGLVSTGAGITLREGDPTLEDIPFGSANQIASRALFTLNIDGAKQSDVDAFRDKVTKAATARGWLPKETGKTEKVQLRVDDKAKALTMEINTDVAMEMPMPQYSKNAVVWGMYLLSQALPEGLELKKAADGITDLFFRDCVEGEAYIGKYMGIPENLLRNPYDGTANLTIAPMANIRYSYKTMEIPKGFQVDVKDFPFYNEETAALELPLYIRSMHTTQANYNAATQAVINACEAKGFGLSSEPTEFSAPTLYLSHDNPLTALQYASYKASIEFDPEEFSGPYELLDITYPVGTTGGTLASNYRNKMTAFGAVIPGNERWWHSANERISVDSIVEMTKMMADGMLEMARYSGSAGAQLMWADLPGLNADRADLDLLDVTVGTYQDASGKITAKALGGDELIGATNFEIHMWADRGNTSKSSAQYELGHKEGGVYLPLSDADFLANTFVLPMRLEFKYDRPSGMSSDEWNALRSGNLDLVRFHLLKDGEAVALTLPKGADAKDYFSIRVDENDPDTLYVAANVAIVDGAYDGVKTVMADSRTDLFKLNDEWLKTHENPFPERGKTEKRGFFLFGDGEKNACFESPEAIFATLDGDGVRFADVSKSDYFHDAVLWAVDKGITSGTGDKTFSPNASCTRGQMLTFLWRAAGSPAPKSAENPFTDVSKSDYFYHAVLWAVEQGITSGTSDSTFSPNATVTRGQTVTFLWRANASPVVNYAMDFADVSGNAYYAEAVRWAVSERITAGTGAGVFSPDAPCTRGQIVTFLWKDCA